MLGLIKLKTLENPVKRMGRKAIYWGKIFVKYICDKALVCKIYKELLKCNNKQPNLKINKRSGHLSKPAYENILKSHVTRKLR